MSVHLVLREESTERTDDTRWPDPVLESFRP
jgi:hypothetical protein